MTAHYRILVVCTGNICRSPSAEAILRHRIAQAGLEDAIAVESAGTSAYHDGEPPSPLAQERAELRGYRLSDLRSRPVVEADFRRFDVILAMDKGHLTRLEAQKPADGSAEIALFLSQSPDLERDEVPDPYYGDARDYDDALDLIEAGCRDWVAVLSEKTSSR